MQHSNLIGLVYNSLMPSAMGVVENIALQLNLQNDYWISPAIQIIDTQERLKQTSLVIVAGGDGTILKTVQTTARYGVPIVGINMGKVGFMSELTLENAVENLPYYINGSAYLEKRMMLEISVSKDMPKHPVRVVQALNDITIGSRDVAGLIEINSSIDGFPLATYRSDALIIATPTGSTGYALSAGGPIMYPESEMILMQPVAAHSGLRDGLIVPPDSRIALCLAKNSKGAISADGLENIPLDPTDRVAVTRSRYTASFLRFNPQQSFYAAFTRRLNSDYTPPQTPMAI